MIYFTDFTPLQTKSSFFAGREFQSMDEVMKDINAWIKQHNAQVFNIETVVLPNMHDEDGPQDAELRTSGEMSSHWNQFFRVWYKD